MKGLERPLALLANVMVNSPPPRVKQAAVCDVALEGSQSIIATGYQRGLELPFIDVLA